MLYIHRLYDLNPKSAEIESIQIIREINKKMKLPIAEQETNLFYNQYTIKPIDNAIMENALILAEPTIAMLKKLISEQDPIHEPINLQRAVQILENVPIQLANNLAYTKDMLDFQNKVIADTIELTNCMPNLKTGEQKTAANERINIIFSKVLRNNEFFFRHNDIINESQTSNIAGLAESIKEGYFFHKTIEEDAVKKLPFSEIKKRIPEQRLKESEDIEKNILLILNGVNQAYDVNLRMNKLVIVFFSFIKWATSNLY